MLSTRAASLLSRLSLLILLLSSASIRSLADIPSAGELSGKIVQEWKFDRDGDFLGWKPNTEIRGPAVKGGVLKGTACGSDPIFTGPVFEIPAATLQWVEIEIRCTAAAHAELYWTETLEGRFGGFSSTKHHLLNVLGDGQNHVYRVWPFWQGAKKIIRLRFDPPDAGDFEVRSIRILQAASTTAASEKAWTAAEMRKAWHVVHQGLDATQPPIGVSPPLALAAAGHPFVCIRMATDQPGTGHLFAASRGHLGWDSMAFALRPDGKMHTYNLDVTALKSWHDTVCLVGLQLPENAGTQVDSVALASDPMGPVELNVSYFGPSEGINRCGRPVGVSCTLKNAGGTAAEPVNLTLHAPDGVRLLDAASKSIDRLTLYLPKTVTWQVQADRPGPIALRLEASAAGSQVAAEASMQLTIPPAIARASYVPEPQPVACKYDVGAFYFPGWSTTERWDPIRTWPNRKPILGWYDEANPECADWQIKWAVEHGIKFFMVDWYWNQGHRHLEHWVHDAFMKARYRKYLKWAVMWANHNPPHSHSADDWQKVTQYWIDNYFGMPEYYRIDNRPVVFIWSPGNVRNDVGGTANAAKLYATSQQMARAAGYPGIYFVAMSSHETNAAAAQLKSEGFESITSYHGFQLAARQAKSTYFPYSTLLDTAKDVWQQAEEHASGMLSMPIVDTGWDPRPWHGDKTTVVLNRTPQQFGALCRMARQYADQTNKRIIAVGPMNEWGEGSYIEPYAEYGFEDLDQLRAAFCEPGNWPPNVIPSDVGRGPYDLPPPVMKTSWEFNTDGDLEGWTSNGHTADLAVRGGLLTGRSVGYDPLLEHSALHVEADQIRHVTFRLRADTAGQVELYWSTTLTKMNGQMVIRVDVPGDNQFHDYTVDLGKHPQWRGIVTALRLDPAVKANVHFAIDYIRLQ